MLGFMWRLPQFFSHIQFFPPILSHFRLYNAFFVTVLGLQWHHLLSVHFL